MQDRMALGALAHAAALTKVESDEIAGWRRTFRRSDACRRL
jgi:hypothetical protein